MMAGVQALTKRAMPRQAMDLVLDDQNVEIYIVSLAKTEI